MNRERIRNANYSEYVGLIQETNRPSGGLKTVQSVCVNSFIDESKKVLEIGSNTGFTSINIALLTGAAVTGVDLVPESIQAAQNKAKEANVEQVNFVKASATELPFDDNSFDLVWLSNVLSFIEDKETALKECIRVLKHNGFLAFIPIYYRENPPRELVNKVGKAIGSDLKVFRKQDWLRFVRTIPANMEITFEEDYLYDDVEKNIDDYLDVVFDKKHLKTINKGCMSLLRQKGARFMNLFNENLKYAGFSIFILQKRNYLEETELFTTKKIVTEGG